MALARFSGYYPSLFDRFFESDLFDWSNRNFSATNTTLPSVNVKESNDDFELEVAAPGLDRDDFKIEIEHGVLRVSSEKEVSNETAEGQHFTQREFSYQSFCRSFTLPESADSDKIEAKYDNGILRINIPKKEEAKPKPLKKIKITR